MFKQKVSYRHSGGISMRIHDDIWTDARVAERHVLLWDDEAADTWDAYTDRQTDRVQKSYNVHICQTKPVGRLQQNDFVLILKSENKLVTRSVDLQLSLTFPYSCGQTESSFDSHNMGDRPPGSQEFKCERKCLLRGRSTLPWPG